jgi:hypothetical protein
MGATLMTQRRKIPVTDPNAAQEAAKAAAAAKAQRAPHTLTEAEAMLLPGRKILELGNAGKLRHLGIGSPTPKQPVAPGGARSAQRGTSKTRTRKGR